MKIELSGSVTIPGLSRGFRPSRRLAVQSSSLQLVLCEAHEPALYLRQTPMSSGIPEPSW